MLDLILLAARLAATIAAGAALVASIVVDHPRRKHAPLWAYVTLVVGTTATLSTLQHLGAISRHTYSRAIGPVAVFVYVALAVIAAHYLTASRRRRRFRAAVDAARIRPEETP